MSPAAELGLCERILATANTRIPSPLAPLALARSVVAALVDLDPADAATAALMEAVRAWPLPDSTWQSGPFSVIAQRAREPLALDAACPALTWTAAVVADLDALARDERRWLARVRAHCTRGQGGVSRDRRRAHTHLLRANALVCPAAGARRGPD